MNVREITRAGQLGRTTPELDAANRALRAWHVELRSAGETASIAVRATSADEARQVALRLAAGRRMWVRSVGAVRHAD